MRQFRPTEVNPNTEPFVNWGVRYVGENTVFVYGPGDDAKTAAERTVQEWINIDAPAELVSQVVYPWRADHGERLKLVKAMREISGDASSVKILRDWLYLQGLDDEYPRRTSLKEQVPIMKQVRRAVNDNEAAELLYKWLIENKYEA